MNVPILVTRVCGACLEESEVAPSEESCPKCGGALLGCHPPAPEAAAVVLVPVKAKPVRRLATADKLVLWLVGLMALGFLVTMSDVDVKARGAVLLAFGCYTVGILVYFAPSLLGKHKTNAGAILLLNICLGWTFIGWVVALIWAATKQAGDEITAETHRRCPACAESVRRAAVVCKHCGAQLSPWGSGNTNGNSVIGTRIH